MRKVRTDFDNCLKLTARDLATSLILTALGPWRGYAHTICTVRRENSIAGTHERMERAELLES